MALQDVGEKEKEHARHNIMPPPLMNYIYGEPLAPHFH